MWSPSTQRKAEHCNSNSGELKKGGSLWLAGLSLAGSLRSTFREREGEEERGAGERERGERRERKKKQNRKRSF